MFAAKVVLDSISPAGKRLISVEFTQPRFVHAEFMTHRDRGRNAASSRAIPWSRKGNDIKTIAEIKAIGGLPIGKGIHGEISLDPNEKYEYWVPNCMYAMIKTDPVVPLRYGRETKGMQQGEDVLSASDEAKAKAIILRMRDHCIAGVEELAALGLHKSICNRYTEPWMWITVLTTATEWNNLFRLRCHPMAEIHFQTCMLMVRKAIRDSVPTELNVGDWHLPYIQLEDSLSTNIDGKINWELLKKVSTGRCARLSYLTHEGRRDHREDVRLHDTLLKPPKDPDEEIMHASPFEHIGECMEDGSHRSGPFIGWKQYRKEFTNENVEGCDPWKYGVVE